MTILSDAIQKKLTQLLGRPVQLGKLDVSVMRGAVDLDSLVILAASEPFVEFTGIAASVAVGKLLSGQLALKSLTVGRAAVHLTREVIVGFKPPKTQPADSDNGGWSFDAQRVQVQELSVTYSDAVAGYSIALGPARIDLVQSGEQATLSVMCESVAAAGHRVGPLTLQTTFKPVRALSAISEAAAMGEININSGAMVGHFAMDRVGTQAARFELSGTLNLAVLQALLPPELIPEVANGMAGVGNVSVAFRGEWSREIGVTLAEMSIRGANVRITSR